MVGQKWGKNGANRTPIYAIKCQERGIPDLSKKPYSPYFTGV
jgi:hypothetical protein